MNQETLQLHTKRQHRSRSAEIGPHHPPQSRHVGGEALEPDKRAPNTPAKVSMAIHGEDEIKPGKTAISKDTIACKGQNSSFTLEQERIAPSPPRKLQGIEVPAIVNTSGKDLVAVQAPEPHLQSVVRNTRKASNEAIDDAASSAQLNTTTPTSQDNKHVKMIAGDCLVELALSLPRNLQDEWDRNIEDRLCTAIAQKIPDGVTSTTVECAMVRSARDAVAVPTILLMCSKAEHKEHIQKILRKCSYISTDFECKVILHSMRRCAAGESSTTMDSGWHDGEFFVERATSVNEEPPILFASLVKIYSTQNVGSPAFSTMGGLVTIDSKLYGLTTAHAIHTTHSLPQQVPSVPGMARKD